MRAAPRPAPFIVGVPRSGTTLLRLMLDSHPELAIPPETYFVTNLIEAAEGGASADDLHRLLTSHRRWGDLGLDPRALRERLGERANRRGKLAPGDAVRAVFGLYAAGQGKPRWGDKTPQYLTKIEPIKHAVPEARFVHLIRDGRAVAVSILAMPERDRPMRAPANAGEVAERWRRRIERARRQARKTGDYLEARYEDLVLETEPTLRRICEFVELDWDEAVLAYHRRAEDRLQELERDLPARDGLPTQPASARVAPHALASRPPQAERIDRWRDELDADQLAEFESAAGQLLAELGYERHPSPPRPGA